ncbi:hypothetical protein [Aliamphritea hakodatensis]|uniref:hypothetical protein n=1 Tax=Aliamphritea hakodatensis TaxID=2895352 RepID=UPI0022FD9AC2|nr:hypothetical protein [Aliamphritea hakodatensis]
MKHQTPKFRKLAADAIDKAESSQLVRGRYSEYEALQADIHLIEQHMDTMSNGDRGRAINTLKILRRPDWHKRRRFNFEIEPRNKLI